MKSESIVDGNDVLGLRYIKSFTLFIMVFIHSSMWLLSLHGTGEYDSHPYVLGLLLAGLFSMTIPATAGAGLRLALNKYFVDNSLCNFPTSKIVGIALFLIFIEGTRGAMSFGISHFFYWNVLHLIAISFLIIVLICQISTKSLLAVSAVSIILTQPIRSLLLPLFSSSSKLTMTAASPGSLKTFFFGLASVSICLFLWWSLKEKKGVKNTAIGSAALLLGFVGLYGLLLKVIIPGGLSMTLATLPISALVGGPQSTHLWPLLPWFSLVAFGFLIFHYYLRAKNKTTYLRKITLLSFALTSYFIYEVISNTLSQVNAQNVWQLILSNSTPSLALGVMGFFIHCVLFCRQFSKWVSHDPFDFFNVYSEAILWIYFIHSIVGFPLAKFFLKHFGLTYSLAIMPTALVTFCYFFGILVIKATNFQKIQIVARKIR